MELIFLCAETDSRQIMNRLIGTISDGDKCYNRNKTGVVIERFMGKTN